MNVSHHLDELIARYPALESCRDDLWKAYEILHDVYSRGGMTLVCGNGGSAADSEHIVGELMKEFEIRRPLPQEEQEKLKAFSAEYGAVVAEHLQGALPAVSLTGGISLSTAFANDAVPELVFAQQAYGYANPQSALIGISQISPHYQLVLTRENYSDALEVKVELIDGSLLTRYGELEALQRSIHDRIKSILGIEIKVSLVEPKTIERFVGKAQRVVDLRKEGK